MSYTRDWSGSRVHWPELFAPLMNRRHLNVLEIGCYEGQATRWFFENLPDVHVTVVDPFDQYPDQLTTFCVNTHLESVRPHRLILVTGRSQEQLPAITPSSFDVVYIDGDHTSHAVLSDAVDAFRLAAPGGWLLFDDYDETGVTPGVKPAVDAFVGCYASLLAGAHRVGRDQFLVVKR